MGLTYFGIGRPADPAPKVGFDVGAIAASWSLTRWSPPMLRPDLVPVILCGGAGTRLWPLSRALYPKQLLRAGGQHSLLQETWERVRGTGAASRAAVRRLQRGAPFSRRAQLQAVGADPTAHPRAGGPQHRACRGTGRAARRAGTAPIRTVAGIALGSRDSGRRGVSAAHCDGGTPAAAARAGWSPSVSFRIARRPATATFAPNCG